MDPTAIHQVADKPPEPTGTVRQPADGRVGRGQPLSKPFRKLSDEQKKKREDELFVREKEVRDLQRQRFGFEGDLFKKRQELVKPIQDRVYNAIQKIAVNRQFDFILDKSEGITVIFADPKLDRSEDVLRELGVK